MLNDIKKFREVINAISYVLTNRQKAQCGVLLILIILGSFMDTLGVALVLPFVQAIMDPQQLFTNQRLALLFNSLHIASNVEIILFTGALLIFIYIIKNAFLAFAAYKRTSLRWNMQRELQTKMLDSYMSRPYTFYLDVNTGDVLNGLVNDVSSFYTVTENMFRFLSYMITIVMIGIYLCMSDLIMSVSMILVFGSSFFGVTLLFRKLLSGAGQRQRMANAESYKYAYQSIHGIKEINVIHRKKFFVNKYDKAVKKSTVENIRFYFLGECPKLIIEAVCICGIVLTICIRYVLGNVDAMFVSTIAVFIVAAMRLLPLVAGIINVANGMVYYVAGLRNTYENIRDAEQYEVELKKYVDDFHEGMGLENIENEKRVLSLVNLTWRYPKTNKDILKGLFMNIHYKQSVGIIGASGAGKTTISEIIMGLYKPQKGQVKYAGKDIFRISEWWSRMVGYVPQSLFLMDDTIRANITFGIDDCEVDDNKVWEAIDRAQLKKYVNELPNGLDTIVGERGIKLSGGQRQRIAIARALYRDPEILILDEATSALDNETEKAVMEAIDLLQGMKTTIIIAHRLSTIKNCDVIYEIKDGVAVLRDNKEFL